MRIAENGSFYLATVFVLSYAESHLGLPRSIPLVGVILSAIIGLFTVPGYAALSDRVGRRPLYLAGALFILFFAYPFFWILNSRSPALMAVAIILVVNVGHDAMYGPQAAFLSELFGPRVRYTGTSLTYQLSSVLSGRNSPADRDGIARGLRSKRGGSLPGHHGTDFNGFGLSGSRIFPARNRAD